MIYYSKSWLVFQLINWLVIVINMTKHQHFDHTQTRGYLVLITSNLIRFFVRQVKRICFIYYPPAIDTGSQVT